MSQPGRPSRYAAFLSYSRATDAGLATAIQQALQRFAKPWYRVRAIRVFRDDNSLAANPGLWTSIATALDDSEYCVLLASTPAAASPWVDREVEHWLARHPPQKMLIAVTGGDLRWDPVRGDFDPAITTCLPPVLYGRLTEEPRWVDFRDVRAEGHLSLRVAAFRDKIADLAAPLHHADKDELAGEDVRQHRRTMRLARSGVAALVVTTVLSVVAAVVAVGQARIATEQRDLVSRQLRLSTQQQLQASADNALRTNPRLGLRLALTAHTVLPGDEARAALVHTLGATRFGGLIHHDAGADNVAFSPTADLVATVDEQLKLSVVRPGAAPRLLSTLTMVTNADGELEFSPDGQTLMMAGFDGNIRLWDVRDPTAPRIRSIARAGGVSVSADFSPDGHLLVSVGGQSMLVWDVSDPGTPRLLRDEKVDGFGTLRSIRFHPDGTSIAVATLGGNVLQWALDGSGQLSRRVTVPAATMSVDATAWNADGSLLAVGIDNGTAAVWDLHDRGHPRLLSDGLGTDRFGVDSMAFAPNRPLLAIGGSNRTVVLWDLTDASHPQRVGDALTGHSTTVRTVAFSPDGRTLATASGEPEVNLWDLTDRLAPTASTLFTPTGFEFITAAVASADGRYLAVTGFDLLSPHFVRVWQKAPGLPFAAPAQRFSFGAVHSMAFQPGTSVLATGYENGAVSLWDLTKPARPIVTLRPVVPPTPTPSKVGALPPPQAHSLAFSADGTVLVVSGLAGAVAVWDLSNGTPQRQATFTDGRGIVNALAFAPTGRLLAATSGSRVYLHDLSDPRAPRRLGPVLAGHSEGVDALAFSADGRVLATGGFDSHVVLWDVRHPDIAARIGQPFTDQAVTTVQRLAFTPDGRTLAASTTSGVLLVWDVTDLYRPRLLGPPITSVQGSTNLFVLAPADRLFVTAAGGGIVRQWDLTGPDRIRSDVVAQVCELAGGGLDEREWAVYVPALPYQPTCAP